MRIIAFLTLIVLVTMLLVHVIKTDIPIEKMERIEKDAVDFARYCYENDYRPEECQ
jgi:hypothetical protein